MKETIKKWEKVEKEANKLRERYESYKEKTEDFIDGLDDSLNNIKNDPELKIDGLLCPGHVSSIIGAKAYQPLAEKFGLACVVAGFETADLVKSLSMLARQVATGDIKVENVYSRVVNWEGNPRAQKMVYEIFEPCDTDWRGLGVIPGSGLKIRDQYQDFDAQVRLEIELPEVEEAKGCMCGQILKGINTPQDCPLYAKRCTPANPIGPCMVSSEGTCAAYFKYGQD